MYDSVIKDQLHKGNIENEKISDMRSKPRVSPPLDISPQEEELGPNPVRRNAKRAAAQKCMSRIRHMQKDDAI